MPDDINNGHEEEMVFISFIYLICFLSDISIAQNFDRLILPPAFEHGFRVLTVQSVSPSSALSGIPWNSIVPPYICRIS